MNRQDRRNQGGKTFLVGQGAWLLVLAHKRMRTLARVGLLALLTAFGTIYAGWTVVYAQASAQSGGTTVYGNISVDTTWTPDKSPYQVTALLNVMPGATLT